jgi:transcriptional regulator
MYVPPAFAETREEVLRDVISAHPLAILVTAGAAAGDTAAAAPQATHLPMTLGEDGGRRVLRGHVARANPHWRALVAPAPAPVLVIFQGAAAYVTPSWYPSKAETGKVVPTWNYEAVHVTGTARAIEDGGWLAAQIRELTNQLEAANPAPWSVDDAPSEFTAALARGIVGIEVAVEAIVGKVKASQNRPEPDRRGVASGLAAAGPAAERLVRRIEETLP